MIDQVVIQLDKLEFVGEIEMDVHDLIVNELFDKKSLAALIFLIDCGRELEFKLNGKEYFISRDCSKKYVSLWEKQNEQSFDSVLELINNAIIENMCFGAAWEQVELEYLY